MRPLPSISKFQTTVILLYIHTPLPSISKPLPLSLAKVAATLAVVDMEDLAASLVSLSHSAPLYLFYNVSTFPKHHGAPLHDDDDGGCGGGFEFATTAKNHDNGGGIDMDSAAPRACSSDVSAFADELFRGGVLLPLKLPPRLQRPASSAAASAATSPTSALAKAPSRSPFAITRRHTGFDPFAAALEKVRRDGAAPRRARSLSPLRGAACAEGPARKDSSCAPRPAGAAAARIAARPPWRRRRGLKHLLCRAVMANAAAPIALRQRRRNDGAPYRWPGLSVCFGF